MEETKTKLYEALAKAQGEIKNAKFNKVNPHYKSPYADLSSLREAYREPLCKYGLSITQTFAGSEKGMILITRLSHQSGESVESCFPINIGANETMQQIGAKITYARRFSIGAMIGIAAEEDDDGNSVSIEPDKRLNGIFKKLSGKNAERFLAWADIMDLSELPANRQEAALKVLMSLEKEQKDETANA